MTAARSPCFSLTAVLGCLFLGCSGAQTTGDSPEPIPSAPPAYVHLFTGMLFPEAAAGFQHGEVNQYDDVGRNVSVGYHNEREVVVTVYVYPVGPRPGFADPLTGEFTDAVAAIDVYFEDLQVSSIWETERHQEGIHARGICLDASGFLSDNGEREHVRTLLYLFRHGEWYIKYRATYPSARGDEGRREVELLIEEIRWPDLRDIEDQPILTMAASRNG